MTPEEMKEKTKKLALRVINLVQALPSTRVGIVIGGQLLRCGTSVGANYRAACRARSGADFIAKLKVVEEDADETLYWLELLTESGIVGPKLLQPLMTECSEILAITVTSIQTARRRSKP